MSIFQNTLDLVVEKDKHFVRPRFGVACLVNEIGGRNLNCGNCYSSNRHSCQEKNA